MALSPDVLAAVEQNQVLKALAKEADTPEARRNLKVGCDLCRLKYAIRVLETNPPKEQAERAIQSIYSAWIETVVTLGGDADEILAYAKAIERAGLDSARELAAARKCSPSPS